MFYVLLFSITELLFLIGEYFSKSNCKKTFFLFSMISIFILCFFAGIRDYKIGVDTEYVVSALQISKILPFNEFISYFNKDTLYFIFVYLTAFLDKSLFLTLFLNELFIILPIFIILYSNRSKISVSLGMLIYLLLFYNFSLCYLRQFMSISMVLFGFFLARKNHKFAGICFMLLSIFIHYIVILFIALLAFCSLKKSNFFNYLITISFAFALLLSPYILNLLCQIGIVPQTYLDAFNDSSKEGVPFGELLVYLPFYSICLYSFRKYKKFNLSLFFMLGLVLLILYFFVTSYLYRISFYFKFLLIFALPYIVSKFRYISKQTLLFFIIALCLFSWLWFVVRIDSEETYPYIMRSLLKCQL